MKLSINWLNTYFKNVPNWDDIFHKLTMAGIEVENVEAKDNDKIVELKITPNRGDVLSVLGLLREINVLTNYDAAKPAGNFNFQSIINDKMRIEIKEVDSCPNYQVLIIKNINNKIVLPDEIIQRLAASGSRSVSPVVDITNYVMLELGQPLHAFDLDKVGGKLSVRFARDGENLTLLAGVEAKLTKKTLVICDANDTPAAIAGVMGGADSGVSVDTSDIVLESACFLPDVIIGKTKYYGVNSDSAYRFERGVDPQLQDLAIRYAASLIVKYCGGEVGVITAATKQMLAKQINVSYAKINRLIGTNISKNNINEILIKLGFAITSQIDEQTITAIVPSHRFDINIKEDIIEEVARIYGYDNIEAQIPFTRYTMNNIRPDFERILKTRLVNLGYNEIISYAFLEDKLESRLGNPEYKAVRLQNPIANLNVMRTSLIADLVSVLQHNLNYGHKRLRIFELARVFYGETNDLQPLKLSGLVYGSYDPENWSSQRRAVDFYDLRNDIETLLGGSRDIRFVSCGNNPVFHGGRCATIELCGKIVGILGQLHPKYRSEFDLIDLPYLFELDIGSIANQKPDFSVKEVSKFQKVERDLAFLTESKVSVGDILELILNANIPYLITAKVFDIYQGDKLADVTLNGSSVKSVAINFLFQGNQTLNEEEINISMTMIQQCIQKHFTIQLRI